MQYKVSAMRLKTNLRGQVKQTTLPKWKAMLPLFEAVMNAFQAIGEVGPSRGLHRIIIDCTRDDRGLDLGDELPPIVSFAITDTGVGFNDDNFDSFNTAFSDHKESRGGKGLGRFMWLVAFERARISSVFTESDSAHPWKREFVFDTSYDPDNAPAEAIATGNPGTTVILEGFKSPYKEECPRNIELLAQRLIEHFILVFLQPNCPTVELHADGTKIILNDLFQSNYKAHSAEYEFTLGNAKFALHGFRLNSPRASKHRLIYAANSRGVLTENLEEHIPNLSTRLEDETGVSFVYLAIVQSPYLDRKVNNFRTDFEISQSDDASSKQMELLQNDEDVTRAAIRKECITAIENELRDYIDSINQQKAERIARYVKDEAPQYKILLRSQNEFIGGISPNASNIDLELALHKELHKREQALKRESTRMISGAEKIRDYDEYRAKFAAFMNSYNELGVSALAQYVMHRKIIIDFLEKAISFNEQTNKWPLEAVVHDIVFPMRSSDQETLYSQQNLWIIDERLTFHSHIYSDRSLKAVKELDSESVRRPDLLIFDKKMLFSETTEDKAPINSLVVVEFKRPRRDNHDEEDNPLLQVFDQIEDVRNSREIGEGRRPIAVANKDIPAMAYIVCDITPSLEKILINNDAQITPDKRSFYGYHRNHRVYYEVIDYGKLLSDAKRRNRAFFEHLNISTPAKP